MVVNVLEVECQEVNDDQQSGRRQGNSYSSGRRQSPTMERLR
jgi:hypothetical protein